MALVESALHVRMEVLVCIRLAHRRIHSRMGMHEPYGIVQFGTSERIVPIGLNMALRGPYDHRVNEVRCAYTLSCVRSYEDGEDFVRQELLGVVVETVQ